MKLFIFMGCSGSGKSTIQHSLPIDFMTNCTTRPLRSDEIDGYHIKQVTHEEFLHLQEIGHFFETTEYAGNKYGTPSQSIINIHEGKPYHCTKDVNGALDLKKKLGDKAVSIYIRPPSIEVIRKRMLTRGDDPEDIYNRIEHLRNTNELENEKYADYVIVNDDLKEAQLEAHKIVITELLKEMKQ